ncbi:MAG: FG-GAP repeat domain-containing protein, partial [Polyangia bacterium]
MRVACLLLLVSGCGAPSPSDLILSSGDDAGAADVAGGPDAALGATGGGAVDAALATAGDMGASDDLAHGAGCRTSDVAGGAAPKFVALADLDGDSRLDLVVVNSLGSASDGIVRVALGKGDGTFAAPHDYAGGSYLAGLAVGDFNGDHHADLAVTLWATNSVAIYLGKGDGTFAAPLTSVTGLSNASQLAVTDFNGDGKLDVAVASDGYDTIAVLLGSGDGTLKTQPPIHFGSGSESWSLAVGDFNRDKKPDLVVAVAGGNTQPSGEPVLLGRGDGTFDEKTRFELGGADPRYVGVTDLNGDGNADLVIAYLASGLGQIGTALGNGDGTFQAVETFGKNVSPGSIAISDFDGDHRPDVLASSGTAVQLF